MTRRREQLDLAATLRADGRSWAEIAAVLRDRHGLSGRVAMRLAHGWGQTDVAAAWTARWPDDPKTFKNVSYWEAWPRPTGHAPSLVVLDRLAQLYDCDVADLVAGWGEHGGPGSETSVAEPETLAWQVGHLDLPELTRTLADWSTRLPAEQQRALLLKLSTAAALAAAAHPAPGHSAPSLPSGALRQLAGIWASTYRYPSTSREAELDGHHTVELAVDGGQLVGRSLAQPSGSRLELALTVTGILASGTWTERTSPTGHYRAATYHGTLQLVVDPTMHSMRGRWLGPSKHFTIKSGEWLLERTP